MNADTELSLDAAKMMAAQAGLDLTDAELTDLLAGIRRTQTQARAGRALLRPELEPAPLFTPPTTRAGTQS